MSPNVPRTTTKRKLKSINETIQETQKFYQFPTIFVIADNTTLGNFVECENDNKCHEQCSIAEYNKTFQNKCRPEHAR